MELYWVVYLPVSFGFVCYYVSQEIGWEDYTFLISFVSKGFPCKDQIEELFIVVVLFCVLPTGNIFNFLTYFTI